jgi:hypothetical protein
VVGGRREGGSLALSRVAGIGNISEIHRLRDLHLKRADFEPFGSVHGIEGNGPFQLVGRWYD